MILNDALIIPYATSPFYNYMYIKKKNSGLQLSSSLNLPIFLFHALSHLMQHTLTATYFLWSQNLILSSQSFSINRHLPPANYSYQTIRYYMVTNMISNYHSRYLLLISMSQPTALYLSLWRISQLNYC